VADRWRIPVELLLHPEVSEMRMAEMRGELNYALSSQNGNEVSALLRKAPYLVFDVDSSDRTPLHTAASNGYEEGVEILLGLGADVNAGKKSYTPLHDAVWYGHPEVAKVLLANGAKVNDLITFVAKLRGRRDLEEFLLLGLGVKTGAE
jgi:ankyrin repeat protein